MPPTQPDGTAPWTKAGWGSILLGYAIVPIAIVALWIATHPVAAAAALGAILVAGRFARWTTSLVRCLRECGAFSIDLGDSVRITVDRTPSPCTC